jgi:hypothetical protein
VTFRTGFRVLIFAVLVTVFAASRAGPQDDYPSDPNWPAFHDADLARSSRRSGLSTTVLKELLRAAGREGDYDYKIGDVDRKSLKKRGQVLVATYDFGTGHCMTVYAIDTRTPYYRKVWEASGTESGDFCTDSILGAPKASVGSEGTILIKLPISNGVVPLSRGNSLLLVVDYVWTGETYQLHAERKFPRYTWNGNDYQVLGK